ncbi:MAG: dihydropteroate synthase, partial [Lachnospiraceae bacterium]|nr:dihydropteroate synthase [Lachnospiraceae bacterium]
MKIGSKDLDLNNTHIMGILNVTPDSFSDGGSYINVDAALKHALEMINEGAAIIDIGGESTRPGSTPVSADEEMNRVIPVIKALRNVSDIPVSIDTYRAETAEEALKSGADLINDIWGLRYDRGEMAKVIADYRVP